jgi:hypothetical protein
MSESNKIVNESFLPLHGAFCDLEKLYNLTVKNFKLSVYWEFCIEGHISYRQVVDVAFLFAHGGMVWKT